MDKKMTGLQNEIKELIISSLNLEGLTIEDIDTDAPLFGAGLAVLVLLQSGASISLVLPGVDREGTGKKLPLSPLHHAG